jgi:hypothetical protein
MSQHAAPTPSELLAELDAWTGRKDLTYSNKVRMLSKALKLELSGTETWFDVLNLARKQLSA